jgi:hypothetical protein
LQVSLTLWYSNAPQSVSAVHSSAHALALASVVEAIAEESSMSSPSRPSWKKPGGQAALLAGSGIEQILQPLFEARAATPSSPSVFHTMLPSTVVP